MGKTSTASDAESDQRSAQPPVMTEELQCEFVTGCAGSGKSYRCMEKMKADPGYMLMCSTTGISAINLGTSTLNSAVGYFDTTSLRLLHNQGRLAKKLFNIRQQYRFLGIDEVSMMDGDQLTLLVEAAEDCNRMASIKPPMGILLTGDFLQLPPVKAKWAFESPAWDRFSANTTRLTKVWRQTEVSFLNALNFARRGSGEQAAGILESEGIEWNAAKMDDFDGTTLVAKNDAVNEFNQRALNRLSGKEITLSNRRWGKQRGEWKQIPDQLQLKEGAYVMVLSNKYNPDGDMAYANGDCGHIVRGSGIRVRLVRTGGEVSVSKVLRDVCQKERPKPWFRPSFGTGWKDSPHYNPEKDKYVEGQIEYWPIRLAYSSTIHKSQGLSLDRVQLDFTDEFAGQPAMLYTSLSRCRSLSGLRLVGPKEIFIKHCRIDDKVRAWL